MVAPWRWSAVAATVPSALATAATRDMHSSSAGHIAQNLMVFWFFRVSLTVYG